MAFGVRKRCPATVAFNRTRFVVGYPFGLQVACHWKVQITNLDFVLFQQLFEGAPALIRADEMRHPGGQRDRNLHEPGKHAFAIPGKLVNQPFLPVLLYGVCVRSLRFHQGEKFSPRLVRVAIQNIRSEESLPAAFLKELDGGRIHLAKNPPGIAYHHRAGERGEPVGIFHGADYTTCDRGDS
jgi:hypothetical protein